MEHVSLAGSQDDERSTGTKRRGNKNVTFSEAALPAIASKKSRPIAEEVQKEPDQSIAEKKTFLELIKENLSTTGGIWISVSAIGCLALDWEVQTAMQVFDRAYMTVHANSGNELVDSLTTTIAGFRMLRVFDYQFVRMADSFVSYISELDNKKEAAGAIIFFTSIRLVGILNSYRLTSVEKGYLNYIHAKSMRLKLPAASNYARPPRGSKQLSGDRPLTRVHFEQFAKDHIAELVEAFSATAEGHKVKDTSEHDQKLVVPDLPQTEDLMDAASKFFNLNWDPDADKANITAVAKKHRESQGTLPAENVQQAASHTEKASEQVPPASVQEEDEPAEKAEKLIEEFRTGFVHLSVPDVEGLAFANVLKEERYIMDGSKLFIPEKLIDVDEMYNADFTTWTRKDFQTRRSFALILAIASRPFEYCMKVFDAANATAETELKQAVRIAVLQQISLAVAFGTGLNLDNTSAGDPINVIEAPIDQVQAEYSILLKRFETLTGLQVFSGDTEAILSSLMSDAYAMSNFTQAISAYARTYQHSADYPRFMTNTLRNFCYMSRNYGKTVQTTRINEKGEIAIRESSWHASFKKVVFRHSIHQMNKIYAIRGLYTGKFREKVGYVLNGPDEYSLKAPAYGTAIISTIRAAIEMFCDIPDANIAKYKDVFRYERSIVENINSLEKFKWSRFSNDVLAEAPKSLPVIEAYLAKFCGTLVVASTDINWRRQFPNLGKLDAPSLKQYADTGMKRKIQQLLQVQNVVGSSGIDTYLKSSKGSELLDELMKHRIAQVADIELRKEKANASEDSF